MAESEVKTTTEKACSLLAGDISSTYGDFSIFTGVNNMEKEAPCVICWAENATEDFPFSAIWHVRTHIIVKEMAMATSSLDSVNSLYGDVYSKFLTGSIETDLTSKVTASYYVYQVLFDGSNSTTEGDAWVNEITLDIVSTTKAT